MDKDNRNRRLDVADEATTRMDNSRSSNDTSRLGEQVEKTKVVVKTEVYSRVVGYFRPTSSWNRAKQQEFKDRKVFKPDKNVDKK